MELGRLLSRSPPPAGNLIPSSSEERNDYFPGAKSWAEKLENNIRVCDDQPDSPPTLQSSFRHRSAAKVSTVICSHVQ